MIHPVPRQYNLSGEPIFTGTPLFTVTGELADYAKKLLDGAFGNKNGCTGVTVSISLEDTRESTYIEEASTLSDEIYTINISETGIAITASCRRGVYRAVNTLIRLVNANDVRIGTIRDYPLFSVRGYIEGFYGNVWEEQKRRSVMKLMAEHGMNTFYYAPKDDPYHRSKWREKYPSAELEELRSLVNLASESEIDFYYCIAPGLSMRYTDKNDFDTLVNKLLSLRGAGISKFGLLLDDIPDKLQYDEDIEEYGETVKAHVDIINRVYTALKNADSTIELTVCPLQYHGNGDEYFISKLGSGIRPDIKLFWTGAEICSRVLTSAEAVRFIEHTRHKPMYWDNYPVNDAEMFNEMHLGPIMGRDKDLWRFSAGLISNVMEYAECSKIPLLTIADYLWNPEAYDCEQSYAYAQSTVLGDKAELFRYFSDHLQVSCLTKHSSAFLSETLEKANFELTRSNPLGAFGILTDYLDNAFECSRMLEDDSVPLFVELKRWSTKYADCCEILKLCLEALCSGDEDVRQSLRIKATAYDRDATLLTGFCLREMTEKVLSDLLSTE